MPLMASNMLQMLFNAADTVVVGRFAGLTSLAAVGSTVSIVALFINLLMGASIGVNVVIAWYLGLTQHEEEISRTLHTSILVAVIGGTLLGMHSDYDMKKWLFDKESASIAHASSINGWSLFERCYGISEKAIHTFREMLDDIPYSHSSDYHLEDTVAWHIYQIYMLYHWGNNNCERDNFCAAVSSNYYPVSQSIRDIVKEVHPSYESLIPFVERMITSPHDELWIYIHYERYFQQVRFLCHTDSRGWIDNVDLTDYENYYNNLVVLHAYCALVQKEEHKNHIVTLHIKHATVKIDIHEVEDVWYRIFNEDEDISASNLNPFSASYTEWKNCRFRCGAAD